MRRVAILIALGAALTLASCGQPQQAEDDAREPGYTDMGADEPQPDVDDFEDLPPVEEALLAAPTSTFTPIEPSEVGVFAAPSVAEALAPLLSPETLDEGASLRFSVRDIDGMQVADIVRGDLPDDAVAAGHVRIEFRREPEGWFPTNAYRRFMCRRGARANQWTTDMCP